MPLTHNGTMNIFFKYIVYIAQIPPQKVGASTREKIAWQHLD